MFFSAQINFPVHKYIFSCAQIYFQCTNKFFSAQINFPVQKYIFRALIYFSVHKYVSEKPSIIDRVWCSNLI